MRVKLVVLAIVFLQVLYAEELPSGFKRCSSKDTVCLKEAIEDALPKLADGIKELGVPPLEPIRVSKLTVGAGNIVKLVQNYEKIDITGLSQSKLSDLSFDLDKGKIAFSLKCPKVDFNGFYVVRGKILILDVFGKGKCNIRLDNLTGKVNMDVQKKEKNGMTYLKVTKFTLDAEPSNVHFQFDNLFDGNKQLGDNINNVLNDNWKEIYDELKYDYLNAIARYTMRLSNKLFEKIPMKFIFLDFPYDKFVHKMVWVKLCILTLSVLQVVSPDQLPPDFKRCSSKDTACLKEAINDSLPKLANGIKELGVPALDPIRVTNFSVKAGRAVQLTQNYENVEFSGLSDTKLSDFSMDLDKGKISIESYWPLTEFKGLYNLRGRLLLLEVYGKGPFSVKYEKIQGRINMDVEKYTKNGDTYLKVTKLTIDAEPQRVYFKFDNLFDGNKLLGDNINRVLNDNWKEIYDDVINDYLKAVSRYLMRLANKLFQKVPLKDIFLD
ncbi:uncharacterized protein LOC123321130 [Coccinella septempunctata]|uniref:uncharacterized protein LOC123321130 n=1 Tax=Coccinella septempunctata TaxID=41139 RepID=UPI001D083260|nr:uncharacterized protein LOC123321130 [Coccinella septempunctata]